MGTAGPAQRSKSALTFSPIRPRHWPPIRRSLGPIKVVLYASSNAPDTDFTAKLVDVFPDGLARNLTDRILRVRYRDSLETPKLMTPGEVYRMTIDAGVTSNVFRADTASGLRFRAAISPASTANPNTGVLPADAKEMHKRATQTVFTIMTVIRTCFCPSFPALPRS